MHFLKKLAVSILVLLLSLSLSIIVASTVFTMTIGRPSNVKSWLRESKVYEASVKSALDNVSKNAAGSDSTLNQPEVQQVIRQTFNASLVQSTVEKVIDGTSHWLDGKTQKPDFVIDLTSVKQSLAENAGNAVVTHINGLPVCTRAQLRQISPDADPFTIPCHPAGIDAAAEKQKVMQEILGNKDLFANPVITYDTIVDKSLENKIGIALLLSYYQYFYQHIDNILWIFGLLAILSAVGIIYLTDNHRHGLHRAAMSVLISGISLIAVLIIVSWAVSKFSSSKNLFKDASPDLQTAMVNLGELVANSINQVLLVFGIIFTILGAGTLVYLRLTQPKVAAKKV
jgi:hypothetical protein